MDAPTLETAIELFATSTYFLGSAWGVAFSATQLTERIRYKRELMPLYEKGLIQEQPTLSNAYRLLDEQPPEPL